MKILDYGCTNLCFNFTPQIKNLEWTLLMFRKIMWNRTSLCGRYVISSCTKVTWLFISNFWENFDGQKKHSKGLFPSWTVAKCLFKSAFRPKILKHTEHLCSSGLSRTISCALLISWKRAICLSVSFFNTKFKEWFWAI